MTGVQSDPLRRAAQAPTLSDIIRKLERKVKQHHSGGRRTRLSNRAAAAAESVAVATRPNYREQDTHAGHAQEEARAAAAAGARPLETTATDVWGGMDSNSNSNSNSSSGPKSHHMEENPEPRSTERHRRGTGSNMILICPLYAIPRERTLWI